MMHVDRNVDLGLISALAVGAVVAGSLLPEGAFLRITLTGPLVLFAPGYAIAAAMLQRSRFDVVERLALGLGLSLALAAWGAVALNLSPWGLSSLTWLVLLAAITAGASLAAGASRATDPATRATRLAVPLPSVRLLDIGLLVVAGLVCVVALKLSSAPPPEQPNQTYAVLWAVPDVQTAETIHLGVQNMQSTRESYVLRVEQSDRTIQEYALQLEPTQTWETDLQLSSGAVQVGGDIQAALFRADAPFTPFRQTVIRPA